jgi:hypothetical protein
MWIDSWVELKKLLSGVLLFLIGAVLVAWIVVLLAVAMGYNKI